MAYPPGCAAVLRCDRPATSRLSTMSRCGPVKIRGRGSVPHRSAAAGSQSRWRAGKCAVPGGGEISPAATCRTNQPRAACFKRPAFFFGLACMRRLTLPQCRPEIATRQRSVQLPLAPFLHGRNWLSFASHADVAELADAQDSGSCGSKIPWRFDPSHPHS